MDFQKPDTAAAVTTATSRRMMTTVMKVKYDDEEGSDDNVAVAEEGEEERIHEIEEKRQRRQLTGAAGRRVTGGGGGGGLICQADKCTADLTEAKRYHRRHKVCEFHAKAPSVLVSALRQRFCQQCSRFHELSEFDETKRSCRRRLAGHNERRRKSTSEPNGEAGGSSSSSDRMKGPSPHCRPTDPERPNRVQMPYPGNPVFKYR